MTKLPTILTIVVAFGVLTACNPLQPTDVTSIRKAVAVVAEPEGGNPPETPATTTTTLPVEPLCTDIAGECVPCVEIGGVCVPCHDEGGACVPNKP